MFLFVKVRKIMADGAVVICLAQAKGGTSKTSSTLNIAACLNAADYKVLVVDLDAQANLTQGLGIDPVEMEHTMFSLLSNSTISYKDILVSTQEGIDLLPANIDLSGLDLSINALIGREKLLARKLREARKEYDFILIDTPPALSLATTNALAAADYVLVPVQPVQFCLNGMQNLIQHVEAVRDNSNPNLRTLGVFVTLYERITAHREIAEVVKQDWGDLAFQTYIRKRSNIHDATLYNRSIISTQPGSDLSQDYQTLAEEILQRVR
jgi:chromosome partitioning protein